MPLPKVSVEPKKNKTPDATDGKCPNMKKNMEGGSSEVFLYSLRILDLYYCSIKSG